jgi:hypothetical protein
MSNLIINYQVIKKNLQTFIIIKTNVKNLKKNFMKIFFFPK